MTVRHVRRTGRQKPIASPDDPREAMAEALGGMLAELWSREPTGTRRRPLESGDPPPGGPSPEVAAADAVRVIRDSPGVRTRPEIRVSPDRV
jgi:hypothetical protein